MGGLLGGGGEGAKDMLVRLLKFLWGLAQPFSSPPPTPLPTPLKITIPFESAYSTGLDWLVGTQQQISSLERKSVNDFKQFWDYGKMLSKRV